MADWEEVRQLAKDLQRLQAVSTVHRLSERNCIELVNRLAEMGLVEVIYTLDGKAYVTPQRLEREIRSELMAHRGRINVVDLQQLLNVDLSHIEGRVGDLLRNDRSLLLLQGELIDRSYLDRLCEEVNDTLQETGQVSLADLSKNFGLPTDFLMENLESGLGTKIKGHLDKTDSGVIYTEAYVARYRARIRGLFSAVTKPTAVGPVIVQGAFQEKLFHSVLSELVSSGQLAGSLHGRLDKAVYIPEVHSHMQNRWADAFLATSGYLEYDALSRLGIDDPRGYISNRYGNRGDIVLLESCCVGVGVVTEVEGAVEEVQASGGWVDILPLLPSPCSLADAELLLQHTCGSNPELRLFGGVASTNSFLHSCLQVFQPLLKERAQKAAATSAAFLTKVSRRGSEEELGQKGGRRKTGVASGGGGRGKEKKGGRGGKKREEEEDVGRREVPWVLRFLTTEEIAQILSEKLPECPEDFVSSIAEHIQVPLQEAFLEEAKECVATLGQGPSAGQQRKRHANLQERVQGMWNTTRLFEKAIAFFDGDVSTQLSWYMLRTLCSDLMNILLAYLAEDSGLACPPLEEMNPKERSRIITSFPDHMKKTLTAINNSLNGKDLGTFFNLFEAVCGEEYCGLMLKKADKKKERQLLFSHQQSLLENLREEQEPAMALHLVTVLLFQQHTNCIIHMPGKLVPHVISFLANHLGEVDHTKMTHYQQLVMQQLKLASKNTSAETRPSPPIPITEENEKQSGALATKEEVTDAADSSAENYGTCTSNTSHDQEESDQQRVAQQLKDLLGDLKQLVVKTKKPSNE